MKERVLLTIDKDVLEKFDELIYPKKRSTYLNEMMERAVTAQIGCHGFVDSFVQCDRCRFQYLPQACKKWRDDNEGVVVVG